MPSARRHADSFCAAAIWAGVAGWGFGGGGSIGAQVLCASSFAGFDLSTRGAP